MADEGLISRERLILIRAHAQWISENIHVFTSEAAREYLKDDAIPRLERMKELAVALIAEASNG